MEMAPILVLQQATLHMLNMLNQMQMAQSMYSSQMFSLEISSEAAKEWSLHLPNHIILLNCLTVL